MVMLIKIVIISALFFIVFHLFRALPILLKDPSSKDNNTHKLSYHLGWRIGLSIGLFFILILLMLFGAITPNPTPF